MVTSVVENSGEKIAMDNLTMECFEELHSFLFDAVYRNPVAKKEEEKVFGLVKGLYDYYINASSQLPDEYKMICEKDGIERAVADYIAGMTDHYAANYFSKIYIPGGWKE